MKLTTVPNFVPHSQTKNQVLTQRRIMHGLQAKLLLHQYLPSLLCITAHINVRYMYSTKLSRKKALYFRLFAYPLTREMHICHRWITDAFVHKADLAANPPRLLDFPCFSKI